MKSEYAIKRFFDFCAFKTKVKRLKSLLCYKTFYQTLITTTKSRSVVLKIAYDTVFIVGNTFTKAFYLEMEKLLLTRKRNGNETAIEFFLSNGSCSHICILRCLLLILSRLNGTDRRFRFFTTLFLFICCYFAIKAVFFITTSPALFIR